MLHDWRLNYDCNNEPSGMVACVECSYTTPNDRTSQAYNEDCKGGRPMPIRRLLPGVAATVYDVRSYIQGRPFAVIPRTMLWLIGGMTHFTGSYIQAWLERTK